jgi:hypothetical protein
MKVAETVRMLETIAWFWYWAAALAIGVGGGVLGARANDQFEGISGTWFVVSLVGALVILWPIGVGLQVLAKVWEHANRAGIAAGAVSAEDEDQDAL